MFQKKTIILLFLSLLVLRSNAQSIGGVTTGAALYCDSLNSGFISLSAFNGQILNWEYSEDKNQTWKKLANTTSTQSYNKLMKTTSFRAIVKDGQFLMDTSSISTITVYVPGNAGILTGGGLFCEDAGNGVVILDKAPGNVISWQYSQDNGYSWSTISHTQTTLSYTSISKNTRYRVIVKTVNGCPNDTTGNVSFQIDAKTITGFISKSDSLCYGAPGDTLKLNNYNGRIVNWFTSVDNGNNWTSLSDTSASMNYSTVTIARWFKAIIKNGSCKAETTLPAVIAVRNANPANAGADVTITRHDKITLQGQGNGSPMWNNPEYLSDAFSFNPLADPINSTTYILMLTDKFGCSTSDTMNVNVIIPIPNIITPNNDGVNDYFEIEDVFNHPSSALSIINRWGIEVYKASPYINEWKGQSNTDKQLPDDIYYYVFDYGNGEKAKSDYILIQR